MTYDFSRCTLCPRECGADRTKTAGICGSDYRIRAAKAQLHYWEEPCISGKNGSGAVFFSGCTLKCCFCQNHQISGENRGMEISTQRLGEIFLELQQKGAHNINLVNPTHYVPQIISALDLVKDRLTIPVVYNCGGYEKEKTLRMLEGYIDIYLPDFKYVSTEISGKYSRAADYCQYAEKALKEMHRQQPELVMDGDLMKKGLIVRHLILPGCRHDSIAAVNRLAEILPRDSFLLSLMSQYTPTENCVNHPEINRRITTFEYKSVLKEVQRLGLNGFSQERTSAKSEYTPDFDFSGL